jgi:nucleoside-diphosphate-sugar epimerase
LGKRGVVVFGATSWVGQSVIESLLKHGWAVTAASRRPDLARIVLGPYSERVTFASNDELGRSGANFEAVVNLAYVKQGSPQRAYQQNRKLVESVHAAAQSAGAKRLIHISSMTVAASRGGFRAAGRVPWRPLGSYVELEINAEHLFEKLQRGNAYQLAIVRLGNVIGPGSPHWVNGLAQRVLEGKPVVPREPWGYSNTTHVANVGEYVSALLVAPAPEIEAFGPWHHLAELGTHTWGEVIEPIARAVGRRPVRFTGAPAAKGSVMKELDLGSVMRRSWERRIGSIARQVLRVASRIDLVDERVERFREAIFRSDAGLTTSGSVEQEDQGLVALLSHRGLFEHHALPGWTPPLGWEDAIAGIADWVERAGYSVRETAPPISELETLETL